MGDSQENFSPELLRAYYRRVFPAELMCRWLGYGTSTAASAQQRLLRRREFSFTTGDDVYIRYLSYDDASAFRKDLCDKLPFKIDIGATFSAPPSEHKKFKVPYSRFPLSLPAASPRSLPRARFHALASTRSLSRTRCPRSLRAAHCR
jgi:hypothetical protein